MTIYKDSWKISFKKEPSFAGWLLKLAPSAIVVNLNAGARFSPYRIGTAKTTCNN